MTSLPPLCVSCFFDDQSLYKEERIDWSQIPFEDNQRIIQALIDKGEGVFPTLDSECLMPTMTDQTFLNKMKTLASTSKVVIKVSIGTVTRAI